MNLDVVITAVISSVGSGGLVWGVTSYWVRNTAQEEARKVLEEFRCSHFQEHLRRVEKGFDDLNNKLDVLLGHLLRKGM